ncbi:MAG: hypothetical protein OHK0038_02660 [Flammeovirgaceae bacterium]
MKPLYSLISNKRNQSENLTFTLRKEEENLNAFFYTYSYEYDWINTKENDIMECSFNQYDSLKLTSKKLYFSYNHRSNQIYLKNLTKLELTFRRLMLPILTGGIVSPLALLAVFLHILTPFLGFSIFLVGLMMLYYGYRGTHQLIFHTNHHITISLFVDDYTEAIGNFVRKTNEFIHQQKNKKWDREKKEKTEMQTENFLKKEFQDTENQSSEKNN